MKLGFRVLLCLCISLSLSFASSAQDNKPNSNTKPASATGGEWQEFRSPDGFSIKMPGVPDASTKQATTIFGRSTQRLYALETPTATYLVSCFDMPARLDDEQSVRMILKVERDNLLVVNQKLKLLSERDVKINGLDARELLIKDNETIILSRIIIKGTRSYKLTLASSRKVVFKKGKPGADATDFNEAYQMLMKNFFDSFALFDVENDLPVVESKNTNGPIVVSSGVITGRSLKLPEPAYPAVAKSAGVEGIVGVEVVIDEQGKVIEAKAISGHPLLRDEAVKAARLALFTPVSLQGTPVKFTGVINFTFSLH